VTNDGSERVKEIVYATHFGVCNVAEIIVEVSNDEFDLNGVLDVIYHLLWVDIPIDIYSSILTLLQQIIEKRWDLLRTGVFAKFMIRLLEQSRCSHAISQFMEGLFRIPNGANWALEVGCKAMSCMSLDQVKSIRVDESIPYHAVQRDLGRIGVSLERASSDDRKAELCWERAFELKHSPEAMFNGLSVLAELHKANGYFAEEIQTRLYQAGLIYGVLLKKQLIDVNFQTLCPSFSLEIVNGEWESCPAFSRASLYSALLAILTRCSESQLYELGFKMIDLIWPLFETHRHYDFHLVNFFKTMSDLGVLADQQPDLSSGCYFKITCFGHVFEGDDARSFVYHENKLAHLYNLSARILD
jgi:hypothetical protein